MTPSAGREKKGSLWRANQRVVEGGGGRMREGELPWFPHIWCPALSVTELLSHPLLHKPSNKSPLVKVILSLYSLLIHWGQLRPQENNSIYCTTRKVKAAANCRWALGLCGTFAAHLHSPTLGWVLNLSSQGQTLLLPSMQLINPPSAWINKCLRNVNHHAHSLFKYFPSCWLGQSWVHLVIHLVRDGFVRLFTFLLFLLTLSMTTKQKHHMIHFLAAVTSRPNGKRETKIKAYCWWLCFWPQFVSKRQWACVPMKKKRGYFQSDETVNYLYNNSINRIL